MNEISTKCDTIDTKGTKSSFHLIYRGLYVLHIKIERMSVVMYNEKIKCI